MRVHTVTLDDDPTVAVLIEGYTQWPSYAFRSQSELFRSPGSLNPVAVFVDVHLEGPGSGLEAIPRIRSTWPLAAILVVTGDSSPEIVGQALACGANDFLRKPLSRIELMGRLNARIYEMQARETAEFFDVGNGRFNHRKRYLEGPLGMIYLSPLQTELMRVLLEHEGTLISKDVLKKMVWGKIAVTDNALDRRLSEMRKIFKESGADIQLMSEYGRGVTLQIRHSRTHPSRQRSA